jgi:hypothetical protein
LTGEITALFAVCDLITPIQRYEHLRREGWPPSDATSDVLQLDRTIYCTIQEFAVRRVGAAIPLRRRAEWGSHSSSGDAEDQWRRMSPESMTREVLNVVLPDDAEESGDDHPWGEFVEGLKSQGISVSAEDLRQLPYNVLFAPRLYDILIGASAGADVALHDLADIQQRTL